MLLKRFILTALSLCFLAVIVSASIVEPVLYSGNPDCCDIGFCESSFKIDSPPWEGVYLIDGGSFTISMINGTHFNFESTLPINAVIVKGGTQSEVYIYETPVFSDTVLGPPFNSGNSKFYDISHIEICYVKSTSVPEFPLKPVFVLIIGGILFITLISMFNYKEKK